MIGGAIVVGGGATVGALFAAAGTLAVAIAKMVVGVGGNFVGTGVGVQGGGGGLTVAIAVTGASPSKRPMICGAVAVGVGGGAVGDGPGVPVVDVPVGNAVGVTQAANPSIAAPAGFPDHPIISASMPTVAALTARTIHRRVSALCPCIPLPSFLHAAPSRYTMPNDARPVKSDAPYDTSPLGKTPPSQAHCTIAQLHFCSG